MDAVRATEYQSDQSYGSYGARNGLIRPIGSNILAGAVTEPYEIHNTIQVPSIDKTGTKTMSESFISICPTFSHELQICFRKLVQLPTGSQGFGRHYTRDCVHYEARKL